MRIIYLGTPEFAVPSLKALIAWPKADVVGLVTQKDRPAGRGHKLTPPPTKVIANAYNIPVMQPEKLSKSPEIVEQMAALKPDVLVMVAFGQILKQPVLEMAPHGVINLHGSLLPAYRGPAPINWSIINGDTRAGVTTMFSDAGVDTGKMLLKAEVPLGSDTTAGELASQLSSVGAKLIIETLDQLLAGKLKPEAQDDSKATYAPLLSKELSNIDWTRPAEAIHNLVRGLQPWPGTYTHFEGNYLKVIKTKLPNEITSAAENDGAVANHHAYGPGEVIKTQGQVLVACGPDGKETIELVEVQPANRAKLFALDWAHGVRLTPGTGFGITNA